jgi:hypothetical protein
MALDFTSRASSAEGLDFSAHAEPVKPAAVKALADARKRAASTPDQVRQIASGASLGFNDEIDAVGAAAETGVNNFIRKATGRKGVGYSAKDAYDAVMTAEKERRDAFGKDHPVENVGLQLAGGLGTPGLRAAGGLIRGATTLGGVVKRSAAVGGALGAVAGAGNAEGGLIKRAEGAGVGLLTGATLGATVPVAARGAQGLIARSGSAISEAGASAKRALGFEDVSKVLTPEKLETAKDTALSYVSDLVARSGRSAGDLIAHPAEAMGKPITAAEAIGRNGVYQLQTLGKRAGATADNLEGMLDARRLDAPNRLTGDIAQSLEVHPEAARGNIDALVAQGQAKAKPLYEAALAKPGPITSDALSAISKRPVVQRALNAVAAQVLNAGEDPHAYGLEVVGMNDAGLPSTVSLKAPTAKTWDMVKKAVADQVERHPITNKPLPDSTHAGNRGVTVASTDLTAALKDAIPGYGDALATAGDYLSHQAAFERVKGAVFKTQMTHGDFAKMWSGFAPSQQEAARASIANDFHNLAQNGRLKPALFNTPSVRNKLATAFGQAKTDALISRVEQEALLAKGQRMTPGTNSTTGETAFAGDEQDNGLGMIAGRAVGRAVTGDGHGAVREIGRAVVSGLLSPVRGAMTPLAQASRDEVGRLLQLKPSELAAELEAFAAKGGRTVVRRGTRTAPVAAKAAAGYAATVVNNP